MYVKSSCESGSVAIPDKVESSLQGMGQANEVALSRMLEGEKQRGQLTQDARVKDITAYLLSVTYGLTVLAGSGKTREELISVTKMAVNTLPFTAPV